MFPQILFKFVSEMLRLSKIINKTLSVKLSLMVVSAIALLLLASMIVMLYYSRKEVKQEALHKASQTLEATVQQIDNLLLSVEQTAGNFYYNMLPHLDNPDKIYTYSRQLVETNPYVDGCAIVFKPDYFPGRSEYMAYYRRVKQTAGDTIVRSDTFGDRSYLQQVWYTKPMASGKPAWLNPLVGMKTDEKPIITFSLPIPGSDGKPVGVIGVDVSLSFITQIVLATKPSTHSYSTLIAEDGSFIVHPDSNKLLHETVFTQLDYEADQSVREAAGAMVSGQSGYKPFHLKGTDYYVFFKPFRRSSVTGRSMEKLKWSVGIVYPEEDIFGNYNNLSYYVLGIAIVGVLLLFLLIKTLIHRQLKPLTILTESAQRIAKGNFNEPIPDSRQNDEIGRLQDNFQQMQRSLSSTISELEQLTATLQERGEGLRVALNEAQKADRMKTAFLHNMTNQMIAPAVAIDSDVEALQRRTGDEAALVADIQQKGDAIAELLKDLIQLSDEEKQTSDEMARKEVEP